MLDGSMVYHYVWTMREGDMFSALEFLSIERYIAVRASGTCVRG